jgi:CRISPR-associated protein Csm4
MGTALRGDTIFGQYCWQVAYDSSLVQDGLEINVSRYHEKPFVVFSSGFPRFEPQPGTTTYAMKRPDLPLSWIFPCHGKDQASSVRERKKNKARKWMLVGADLTLNASEAVYIDDRELLQRMGNQSSSMMVEHEATQVFASFSQLHNTINRETGTTGSGEFAPYTQEAGSYYPGVTIAVFALIDTALTDISSVETGLERMGKQGFGKDASIGLGRFSVEATRPLRFPEVGGSTAVYCMAPTVPAGESYREAYFLPFVRFGKHGDSLACSGNPFKNPVIMADEGAIFVPKEEVALRRPYWGKAVTNVSLSQPETIVQGYSICLPIRIDAGGET